MRLGIVRLQFQCPAATGGRFVQLPMVPDTLPRLLWKAASSPFNPIARPMYSTATSCLPAWWASTPRRCQRIGMIRLRLRESAGRSARQLAAGRLDGVGSQSPMLRKSLPYHLIVQCDSNRKCHAKNAASIPHAAKNGTFRHRTTLARSASEGRRYRPSLALRASVNASRVQYNILVRAHQKQPPRRV